MRAMSGGGRCRDLDHIEVFLCHDAAVYAEAKLIATWGGEQECGDIDAEVGNLQTVADDDFRERCAADELICVHVHQVDFEVIRPLGVGHAEVEAELLVLKWECHRMEVGEEADQRFFLGQTIFDDAVADQEGLHAGSRDISHVTRPTSAEHRCAAAGFEHIAKQRMGGSDAAEV